jgi:hypothetical protein
MQVRAWASALMHGAQRGVVPRQASWTALQRLMAFSRLTGARLRLQRGFCQVRMHVAPSLAAARLDKRRCMR